MSKNQELDPLSLLQQISPVISVSVMGLISEAKQVVPLTARNQRRRPQVSIYPNGQGHFSSAFDPLLGKAKAVPFGTHPHLTFRWGLDAERKQVIDYDQETEEITWGPTGVLFVQFSDTETDFSIEIKSRYPRNVIGFQSVLQGIEEFFGKEGFPMREVEKGHPAKYLLPDIDSSGNLTEVKGWDVISWRPLAGERYLFRGPTLEIDVENRTCALIWSRSIVTKTEKKAATDDFDDSESSTADADISSELGGNGEGDSTTN